MEEGTLAKWLVKEGDTVKSGQIIAEIETDKATMEFEAVDEGIIGRILVAEGTAGVKVNTPIAVMVEAGRKCRCRPCPGGGRRPGPGAAPQPQPAPRPQSPRRWRSGCASLARLAGRHGDEDDDRARSPARSDGRGNARQ